MTKSYSRLECPKAGGLWRLRRRRRVQPREPQVLGRNWPPEPEKTLTDGMSLHIPNSQSNTKCSKVYVRERNALDIFGPNLISIFRQSTDKASGMIWKDHISSTKMDALNIRNEHLRPCRSAPGRGRRARAAWHMHKTCQYGHQFNLKKNRIQ